MNKKQGSYIIYIAVATNQELEYKTIRTRSFSARKTYPTPTGNIYRFRKNRHESCPSAAIYHKAEWHAT